MRNTRLCLSLNEQFRIPLEDQIRLFKQIGFEGFFSPWKAGCDMAALRKAADGEGMLWQSVHGPFHKSRSMWVPTDETEAARSELIQCLRDCAENGVPLMVTHAFITFGEHEPTPFGLRNFETVVREAERLGVKIAFENAEGVEYLRAVLDHFRGSPAVGFCWDTGHQMCYNFDTDLMALYGDRLLGTHIHDNLGCKDFAGNPSPRDDLHLLPFDGIGDWPDIAAKIKRSGFAGPLTFELKIVSQPGRHENDVYARMNLTDYLTAAYARACRVAALVQRA